MKLTKSKLKQIIREELEATGQEEEDVSAKPEEEELSDVAKMLNYLELINTWQEYNQVLRAILNHGANVSGANRVLREIYKELPKLIEKMK